MLRGIYVIGPLLSTESGRVMPDEWTNWRRKMKSPVSGRASKEGIYHEL
jgi:hypothetical protein